MNDQVCPATDVSIPPERTLVMNDKVAERLARHYNRKYISASAGGDTIPLRRYPANRLEASVKCAGRGRKALEIGAGGGELLRTLRPCYERWVATEISRPRLEALSTEFANDDAVQIIEHNIEHQSLPFADDYFDLILLIDVLEHFVDPISSLAELYRVMAEGGRLLIDTPNIAKWTRRIKLMCGYFPATASTDEGLIMYDHKTPTDLHDEGHLHYFTFRSLAAILKDRIGFSQVIYNGYGRLGLLSRLWPTLFSDTFVIAVK